MNKNILFIILAILLVGAGLYMSNASNVSDKNQGANIIIDESNNKMVRVEDDSMMENEDDAMMKDDDAVVMATGEYVDYNSQLLSRANDGNVVLFFHAGWCPTCKALDSDLKEKISNFPKDLTILKVDYDNASELKKKYAVTYQHTLVQVDANGNMISKWNGGNKLEDVISKLR